MKQEYTLTIYTENRVSLINKIAITLSRRKINLESLNISLDEKQKTYRFTLVLNETESMMKNLTLQIEKMVDIFEVYCNTSDEIIWQEIALYKVPTATIIKEAAVERLLKNYGAKAVAIQKDYTVLEARGQDKEVNDLLQELRKFGLTEFVRSSRIAILKSSEGIYKKILDPKRKTQQEKTSNNEFLNHKNMIFEI